MNLLRTLALMLVTLNLPTIVLANPVEYQIQTSSHAGPTIAVIGYRSEAGAAGTCAASQIANWEISRGTLVVLLEGNESPLIHERQQSRWGSRSQWGNSIQEILGQVKPDRVIQLTESYDAKSTIHEANGATIFCNGNGEDLLKQLKSMASAAQSAGETDEPVWQSVLLNQSDSGYTTISVVTSAKDPRKRPLWIRTRQQRSAVHALLSQLKMRPETASLDDMMSSEQEDGKIRVAIYQGPGAVSGSGHDPVWIQQTLNAIPDFQTALIGPAEIQSGGLAQFDVLMIGGGYSIRQSKGLGPEGRAAVLKYVRDGGGYVGICAGMFLACSEADYRLGLLPFKAASCSGVGKVKLDFDADEIQLKGIYPAKYSCGPAKVSKLDSADKSVRILAYFRSEPQEKTTSRKLTDTPAIVCGNHGQGCVFLFSPHCERYPGPRSAFSNAIRWAAKAELPKN